MTDAATIPDRSERIHGGDRKPKTRHHPLRSQIIEYLAANGASKVSEISIALTYSRETVRYHLTALEAASIVRSNISPGSRTRFTPFYALSVAGHGSHHGPIARIRP